VGFGGRIMPGEDGPKYMNTGQTKLYDKSRVLFALDRAKAGIVQADEVVVCEGYTDVTAFFRVGVPRAVATCGTALTDDHVQLLRRFARRIVLAFDADTAGQAAADRFYRWEDKFDLDVVVAALPAGVDPGDMADSDPEGLMAAVAEARPFLEYRLSRILDGADLDSAEHRARAAEDALSVIVEHPNDLVRDQYLMQVADRCRVDVARLRERLRSGKVKRRPPPEEPKRRREEHDDDPGPPEPAPDGDPGPGDRSYRAGVPAPQSSSAVEVLRLAVNRPETVIDWLDERLFDDPLHRETYRALMEASTIHEAIESAPPDVASLLSRLAVEEPVVDPLDPILLLVRSFGLRELAIERASGNADLDVLARLARLVGQIGEGGDRGAVAARELLTFVTRQGASS